MYEGDVLSPLEQLRVIPTSNDSIEITGSYAYYIRPDGETLREVLVTYPNGGIPDIPDARKRARFGVNAEYYRARQRRKGFEFVGPKLTEQAIRRVVDILKENQPDAILYAEDEIANCQHTIENNDRPEVRDQARRRKAQFEKRLEYLRQEIDPAVMIAELNDIARAQQLASVDPNIMSVMKAWLGEVSESLEQKISFFAKGKAISAEGKPTGKMSRGAGISLADVEASVDFIDAD